MNCIDFRRGILANPRQPGEPQLAHAAECAACREFLERQREMDAELFSALQVPPPDGLADRIIVARGLKPHRWLWPVAAGVVLAVGVGLLVPRLGAGDPLGREAIAHVGLEPQSFTTAHAVPSDLLTALLSEQRMAAVRAVGQITYSRVCPLAGKVARHLVLRTAQGTPVTLFLLPDDPQVRKRAVTERDGMAAVVIPTAKGSITIVATSLDHALAMEKALQAT